MMAGERQAVAVAAGEQVALALIAALPDRADAVDDIAGRQPIAARDPRLSGRAAADAPALLQQFRPGGAMDRAIHAAAAEQAVIGGIDDRVDRATGDVARHHVPARRPDHHSLNP